MKLQKIHKTYILSFLFSLHVALSAYVNSSFLTKIISEKYVGLIFVVSSIISLVFLSQSSSFLKSFGNRKLTLAFIFMNVLGLSGMIFSSNPYIVGTAFVLFNITNTLFFFCIDIFVEHFSDKKSIGRVHGVYLTVYNIAWMISPFITGRLASDGHGYVPVYTFAFITALITMIGFISWVPSFHDASYSKVPFFQAYKFIREKHHLASINLINFILQFFFVWMVIYTPIYLVEHLGFTWENIGIMFTWMLAPFVVIPLTLGMIIDKYKIHKRTAIVVGTIIMSLSTIAITFMDTKSIAFWAFILCMTRVGAAMVETVSEMYFFTHVREEDAHLLSIFRDMSPLSYLVAPLLGTAILLFFPFKYLFIILGLFVLSILYYVPRLKHAKNELHLSH